MAALTAKQERFVQEYMVDLNATQAAIRAGYSAKNADKIGPELLGKTRVRAAIEAAKATRAKRVQIDADWVVKMARKNIKRALQEEPILDRDGNPTGLYKYDGAVVNGALNLLAKHTGGFVEKHEHTGASGGPIVVQFVHESKKRTAS
jgi:phage terminase small subunit